MNKLLINFIVSFCIFVMNSNVIAMASTTNQKDNISDKGSIVLREVLLRHQMLAKTKESHSDNEKILGSMLLLNNNKYEIVSFKFENTTGIASDKTFEEYVKINNLLYMRSVMSESPEGEVLEVFDSSRSNLDDDISFNIALRLVDAK
ncbi:MAG: hypothetical protein AB8B68_04625 [Rickettsiaceae bacterium]